MSMPSSSDAVATSAFSSPRFRRCSASKRRSFARLPWWAATEEAAGVEAAGLRARMRSAICDRAPLARVARAPALLVAVEPLGQDADRLVPQAVACSRTRASCDVLESVARGDRRSASTLRSTSPLRAASRAARSARSRWRMWPLSTMRSRCRASLGTSGLWALRSEPCCNSGSCSSRAPAHCRVSRRRETARLLRSAFASPTARCA